MVDLASRPLAGFQGGSNRLSVRVWEPPLTDPAGPKLELITRRLAPDRSCDRANLVLAQGWSALQTVGFQERGKDDRRRRPTSAHRARERRQAGVALDSNNML